MADSWRLFEIWLNKCISDSRIIIVLLPGMQEIWMEYFKGYFQGQSAANFQPWSFLPQTSPLYFIWLFTLKSRAGFNKKVA